MNSVRAGDARNLKIAGGLFLRRVGNDPAALGANKRGRQMTDTTFDIDVIAASGAQPVSFADGVMIHRRGDFGDRAYIVARGRVELRQKGRVVETVGPGEIFGEAGLLDTAPRLASAVAIGTVELFPIDRQMFVVLVRDDEDFALTVVRLLARRLRATTEMFERCVEDLPARPDAAISARATA
jgi:CRP/FNR family transcriptional regulator, cyclic AMP receptor protein